MELFVGRKILEVKLWVWRSMLTKTLAAVALSHAYK